MGLRPLLRPARGGPRSHFFTCNYGYYNVKRCFSEECQWISEEYADSNRNWATIDAVVRVAKEIGATPAQVALSWIADRPSVIAPIVGARTVEHLRNNLGAAELTLNEETTAALEKVSAPQSGGYPYGAFGAGQRSRWLQDGTPAPKQPFAEGSSHPLGKKAINP
jgi:hypothetical protein